MATNKKTAARPSDFQRFLATMQSAAPASLPRDLAPSATRPSRGRPASCDEWAAIAYELLSNAQQARRDEMAVIRAANAIISALRGPTSASRMGGEMAVRVLVGVLRGADRKLPS